MFLAALGTDTGGSVRQPAAMCGVSGLKQTFGLVPNRGSIPLGVTCDHIGPLARSARDCAEILQVIAGPDPADPSSTPGCSAANCVAALDGDLGGVTVGVDRVHHFGTDFEDPRMPGAFDDALAVLRAAGARVVEVEIPFYDEVKFATQMSYLTEAFGFHRHQLATRWNDYGQHTRTTLGLGALVNAHDYFQCRQVRRIGSLALADLMHQVDVIVGPTMACDSILLNELTDRDRLIASTFTHYWNGVGNPVVSIPMGLGSRLQPLGMQVAARLGEDAMALKVADAFQRVTDFHLHEPPLIGSEAT
jgi:aspartyl-tRNA(Asn)/glutamyl-tRNA(Gln) amidotransferase subunit A